MENLASHHQWKHTGGDYTGLLFVSSVGKERGGGFHFRCRQKCQVLPTPLFNRAPTLSAYLGRGRIKAEIVPEENDFGQAQCGT